MNKKDRRQIPVVAAIIEERGKYLITRRPLDKHLGGMWEFPGGKVEFGEKPEDSLKRKMGEELGIEIYVRDLVHVSSVVYNENLNVLLMGYYCSHLSGDIQMREIMDYHWVKPIDMSRYEMPEADLPIVEKLMGVKG